MPAFPCRAAGHDDAAGRRPPSAPATSGRPTVSSRSSTRSACDSARVRRSRSSARVGRHTTMQRIGHKMKKPLHRSGEEAWVRRSSRLSDAVARLGLSPVGAIKPPPAQIRTRAVRRRAWRGGRKRTGREPCRPHERRRTLPDARPRLSNRCRFGLNLVKLATIGRLYLIMGLTGLHPAIRRQCRSTMRFRSRALLALFTASRDLAARGRPHGDAVDEVRPAWSASAARCSPATRSKNSRSTSSACSKTSSARAAA